MRGELRGGPRGERRGGYRVVCATESARARREFIEFPKRLYRGHRLWVPMFDTDMRLLLSRKHPFFLHSPGEFFLLERAGETVGRCMVADNRRYNEHHGTSFAFFDFFDCIDDERGAAALFDHVGSWAAARGLDGLCGPMLSGGSCGAGVLVQGFEYPAAMTMMRYNYPYYQRLLEGCGFQKYVDLNSLSVPPERMALPERIERLAQRVLERGRFKILAMSSRRDLRRVAPRLKELYGRTLSHHLEDYPLTPQELDQVEKDLLAVADPGLVTILTYDGQIVGYAFGFADVSPALRSNRGRLGPLCILRLLRGIRSARKILFNGLGILPEYQKLGGNAVMYDRMARVVRERGFEEIEMVQISEQTDLMLRDASSLGGKPFKVHRMYHKTLR
jgi:hypothetical protein